jgi:hypothetical protein
MLRKVLLVSVFGAVLGIGGVASATNVGILDNVTGYVNGEHVYISPLVINGVTYYCVTPDREQALGSTDQNFVPVSFTSSTSVQVAGQAESASQIASVAYLIDQGHNATGKLAAEYAGAIWDTEGSPTTYDDLSLAAPAEALYQGAIGKVGHADYIADAHFVGQSGGAVPEPASWAMMLVGFGGVGATIRSRRRAIPALAKSNGGNSQYLRLL